MAPAIQAPENRRGLAIAALSLTLLAGCGTGLDLGYYNLGQSQGTALTAARPTPDARGVISYPSYQVVVARRGDTVATIAQRVGLGADELARFNGLTPDYAPRGGELLSLPRRVAESNGASGGLDIASIAAAAIDNADTATPAADGKTGPRIEPIRHRVERGETAYSIARLYSVSVTALASWNGLGPDLSVREGQQLLIPLVNTPAPKLADASKPGKISTTPVPPSASEPLPDPVISEPIPASPNMAKYKSPDSAGRKYMMPVQGKIISAYSGKSGGNEGIDIAAAAGTAVKAAEDGTVALVSKSVGAKTIVLLRHADNYYTVYSNITGVRLRKGDKVKRGQPLGTVAAGNPTYLHFEIRKGTQSVDPKTLL